MQKLFGFALLLALGGCYIPGYDPVGVGIPGTNRKIVPQAGVEVQVFDNCSADVGRVIPSRGESWQTHRQRMIYVFIPFSGYYAQTTFIAYDNKGKLLGTLSRSFDGYYNQHITRVQWIIGGNSNGGGANIVIDHLSDQHGKQIC